MGGNYYNDFRCDLFDARRAFIKMCEGFSENTNTPNINVTNNITIINNNITVEPEKNVLKSAIVFY